MFVVSHGNGGFGGGRNGGGDMVFMQDKARGVGRMSRDVGALPECDV